MTACQDGYVCTWARPGLQTRCSDLGAESANNHYSLTPGPTSPPANQVRTSAGVSGADYSNISSFRAGVAVAALEQLCDNSEVIP